MMKPFDPFTEKQLLIKLQKGDEQAFAEIYNAYKRRLAVNLMRLLKSREIVDEALQDIFLKLWNNRAKIDPDSSIRGYLFRIAENQVMDFFRQVTRDEKMKTTLQMTLQETNVNPEQQLMAKEKLQMLQKVIELLPPQRKKVFILCKIENKSYEEVSSLLNISTTTINDHITRANIFLKQHFPTNAMIQLLITLAIATFNE
jgi:RNA polymerase sigma-70 factor (family 1)